MEMVIEEMLIVYPLHAWQAAKGLQLSVEVFLAGDFFSFCDGPSFLWELHSPQQSTFSSCLLKPAYIAFTLGAEAKKTM